MRPKQGAGLCMIGRSLDHNIPMEIMQAMFGILRVNRGKVV